MSMKFADTPKGWYQEKACGILASLSLIIDANERMHIRGGSLQWVYRHEMEHHFKQAVFDTLRLLQILTHDTKSRLLHPKVGPENHNFGPSHGEN